MKVKELLEAKNNVIADMKALTNCEDNFDLAKFEAKEQELKDIQDKIESLDKINKLTVDNSTEKVEKVGKETMEFKNAILEGKEMKVEIKNAMTTTNVKMEKVSNGQHVAEKAQENPILGHIRQIPVNGTSIVPVQKGKLGKLVKADELAEIGKKDVLFEKVDLRPEKYASIIAVSEELMNSEAYDVEAVITEECRQAINDTLAELVITGDDTAFGLEKATKEMGAKEVTRKAPSALTLDDINALYFALDSKFRKEAVWVVNDADLRLLMTLTDNQGRPIVQSDLTKEFAFTIYGRPVVESEDATKMYFADLAQGMVVASGATAEIRKSTESMFEVAGIAFRVTSYADVKPAITKAIAFMA